MEDIGGANSQLDVTGFVEHSAQKQQKVHYISHTGSQKKS